MAKSVVIVGAGIAGLTAAYRLAELGMNVTVLEASDRVGGRMTTDRRDGYVIDRGAQFLSDGYRVIGGLVADLGLDHLRCAASGWTGVVRDGSVLRVNVRRPATVAGSGLLRWRDAFRVALRSFALSLKTRELPLGDYSRWHSLDDADAAGWVRSTFGPEALDYLFEPMLEGFFFQEPEQVSRAWAANLWSFGMRSGIPTALTDGLGSLPEALAAQVAVSLNTPVHSVEASGTGVSVRTPAKTIEADYAVVATTASAARRLYRGTDGVESRLLDTGYSATINISIALTDAVPTSRVAADIYGVLVPRKEREVIAAIAVESRKCRSYVARGELLNVMLSGVAGRRLLDASDDRLLEQVLPELQRYFPGIEGKIAFTSICRWNEAEPHSAIGRSRDLLAYRKMWNPAMRVILAGDYMGIPCTEGAAESGSWAAARLVDWSRSARRRSVESSMDPDRLLRGHAVHRAHAKAAGTVL